MSSCICWEELFPSLFSISPFSSLSLPKKQSKLPNAPCSPQANYRQADTHVQLAIPLRETVHLVHGKTSRPLQQPYTLRVGQFPPASFLPLAYGKWWDLLTRWLNTQDLDQHCFEGAYGNSWKWKSKVIFFKRWFLNTSEPDMFFTLTPLQTRKS